MGNSSGIKPVVFLDKPIITGAVILGDSLSDEARKYNEKIAGCIPFKWFFYHSDYNTFSNGHTWAWLLQNILNNLAKKYASWPTWQKLGFNDYKNIAEGGATAYNYRNITSFFKHIKGFLLSFFLGNIQNQAKQLKTKIRNSNDLVIILAGANDIVTLGYDDADGVERALQGFRNTLEILIKKGFKHSFIIGLPDISETPRFANKSAKKRQAIKKACEEYNQGLQKLAEEYQTINFDFCTIYKYTNINRFDLQLVNKIEKGVVITGEGENRKVIFINNGEFIVDKTTKKLKVIDVLLSKEQLALFTKKKDGEIKREENNKNILTEFVDKVVAKAKLNIGIKMLNIQATLDRILQNPEDYGFTAGCAVYFLSEQGEGQASDVDLISRKITCGNAVIIKKEGNGFLGYLVKDGKLVTEEKIAAKVKFSLSLEDQIWLTRKLKPHSSEGLVKLASMEDLHDICIMDIVRSVVEQYKRVFHKGITLTNINETVLEAIKKGYQSKDDISWDGLHPARRLHDLLAVEIAKKVEDNFLIQNSSSFRDDSAIDVKPKLQPNQCNESPASLPSVPSLMRK